MSNEQFEIKILSRQFVSSRITVKNLLLVDLCFESQALEGAPTTSEKKKGVDKKIFSQIV